MKTARCSVCQALKVFLFNYAYISIDLIHVNTNEVCGNPRDTSVFPEASGPTGDFFEKKFFRYGQGLLK